MAKKGVRKCANCAKWGKWKYKKGAKNFCTQKCKNDYFGDHVPTLKKKLQVIFNQFITKDQPCAVCGKRFEKMDCSHILSRGAHDSLRFDVFNALPMCSGDHQYFWHDSPLEAMEWFKNKYPERYEYLMFAKNLYKGWSADELKEIKRAIKRHELKSLVRFMDEYKQNKTAY